MVAGLARVARHRVAVDAHESLGLANAATVGDMFQDRDGLFFGQM